MKGPFRSFVHEHYFFDTHEGTRVVDRVVYAPPGGALSDRLLVAADLERIFSWRASAVKATLEPAGEASVRLAAVAD